MDTQIFIYLGLIILALIIAYLLGKTHRKPQDFPQDIIDLYRKVDGLPVRILQTIQGSINPQKGKMAELLTYAELRLDYDRIIPLGQPVDFVGIKNNERIDFIEVKSGESFILTDEEKHIRKLVTEGRVNFRLIKITESEINQFMTAQRK